MIDELNMENWKRAMDALGAAAVMAKAAEDAEIAREEVAASAPRISLPASGIDAGGRGGCCTQAQLDALEKCESGGVSTPGFVGGWRTGLFGIESGNEGSKSYAQQVADVEAIYAAHGPSAWGCSAAFG